uniref:Uncharacterized protein n=1 Tax=Sphaerodactylus townsendi TaxID=933632 RepID=A0ACB8EHQ1_9SAUR
MRFCSNINMIKQESPQSNKQLVLEQDVVLQSIDRAIEAIHNAAMKNGGKYNLEQRDVLQKLIHHRKETVSRKGHSPSTQGMTPSSSDHHLDLARQPNGFCRTGYERHHSLPNTEPQEEEGAQHFHSMALPVKVIITIAMALPVKVIITAFPFQETSSLENHSIVT